VGVGGDVEHVFKPVGAVRDLHVDPVAFLVLHATVPVDMEAEDVFVEFVFGGAIANDEASVNQASANLTGGSRELAVSGRLHEGDRKTFGILKRKVNGAVEISGNRLGPDAVSLEITVHSHRVSSRKGDFSEKICLRAGGPFFQRNLLVLAQDVTRAHHARATGVARGEAKNFARSEEHTSELQSRSDLVCRLL